MKKMTRFVLGTAAAAAMMLPSAKAGEASFGADVVSAYVFRGGTINDEVNVQPYVEGAFGAVTAGTWGNYNTDSSAFDEIDYYASVALPLGESPVGVDLGYTFYTYPEAASLTDSGEAVGVAADQELNIGISLDAPLSPSIGVNLGVDGGIKDSVYVELGLGHEVEISDSVAASAGVTVGIVADEGDLYGDTGVSFVGLSAGIGSGPVSLGVSYIIETDDDVLVVDEDVIGILSLDIGAALAMLDE